MDCQTSRQLLLDLGIDDAQRRNLQSALQHLEGCEGCRAAVHAFDDIAGTLKSDASGAIPPSGWQVFEQSLATTIGPRPRRHSWPWALGIAASLLLAVGTYQLGRMAPSVPQGPAIAQAGSPEVTPADVAKDVGAFKEVSKVFDGRASWVLVSNEASDVGVSGQPLATSGQVRLLRLTMSQGNRVVSNADLLIIPGQTADLKIPVSGGKSLHYLISTTADGPAHVSIRFEVVAPSDHQPLATLATTLKVEPGAEFNAGQIATASGDYRLNVGYAQSELASAIP
jgi:hypothetical protein